MPRSSAPARLLTLLCRAPGSPSLGTRHAAQAWLQPRPSPALRPPHATPADESSRRRAGQRLRLGSWALGLPPAPSVGLNRPHPSRTLSPACSACPPLWLCCHSSGALAHLHPGSRVHVQMPASCPIISPWLPNDGSLHCPGLSACLSLPELLTHGTRSLQPSSTGPSILPGLRTLLGFLLLPGNPSTPSFNWHSTPASVKRSTRSQHPPPPPQCQAPQLRPAQNQVHPPPNLLLLCHLPQQHPPQHPGHNGAVLSPLVSPASTPVSLPTFPACPGLCVRAHLSAPLANLLSETLIAPPAYPKPSDGCRWDQVQIPPWNTVPPSALRLLQLASR